MAQVLVNETSLVAIADAIRGKNGSADTYKPGEMAEAISSLPSGGGAEVEPIVLTGDCSSLFSNLLAQKYFELFSNTLSTSGVTKTSNMFSKFPYSYIPFDINIDNSTYNSMAHMFNGSKITELPAVINAYPSECLSLLYGCELLREIPEDWMDTWNFDRVYTYSSADLSSIFKNCYSLRHIPTKILSKLHNDKTNSYFYSLYYNLFESNYVLDEIIGLPVVGSTLAGNVFANTLKDNYRLKNFIFETNEDGSAKTANWTKQTFNFIYNVGWGSDFKLYGPVKITDYNSGITADKEVTDDATYQALKNDPDWFTGNVAYSRYNHDSAVATINSLPDTSAYLASAGGTNTIRFKGAAGEKTDGGAVNTLTEEEIAVATAKGWTISFT